MKTKIQVIIGLVVILYFAFNGNSCKKDVECNGFECFSIDSFAANIKKTLGGNCMGYAFVIDYKGNRERIFADGKRRTAKDGGDLSYDLFSKFHIASMSKTITAIATLQLLKKNNLSTYTLIKDYLPADWQLGPKADKITFRQLLRHESGLRLHFPKDDNCDGESYAQLKCQLQEGVADSFGINQYQNMNFALQRILISKLAGNPHQQQNNDIWTADKYINYVRTNIMEPCNVLGVAGCVPDTSLHYYVWPYDNSFGQLYDDYSKSSGAYGWFLSVNDYGNIISKLFNSETLLNAAWRDTMTVNNLGCYPGNCHDGTYFNHNGGWGITWTWNGKTTKGSANCGWVYFPSGISCVVMVNSDLPAGTWFPGIIEQAYNKSWK